VILGPLKLGTDAFHCVSGHACGALGADVDPVNLGKGIAQAVSSIVSDIAHGHVGSG
jgi:hypothetical protein